MLTLHFGVFFFGAYLLIQPGCSSGASEKGATSTRGKNLQHTHEDATTPSPEWLEYQRERFSNAKDVETLKKMLDPGSQLLKNKEHIIMPTKVINENSKQEKLEIQEQNSAKNTKVEIERKEPKPEVNTTNEKEEDEDEVMRSEEEKTPMLLHVIKGLESPSLRGFLSFLKTVKRNWARQSKFTIEQKLNSLRKLKHRMMLMIEDGYNMIWTPKVHMRRKRGLLEESNLNFPPETALITINFLTFAVFLIKLVMQVVHVVKSKHYTLSGLNLTKAGTMTT